MAEIAGAHTLEILHQRQFSSMRTLEGVGCVVPDNVLGS